MYDPMGPLLVCCSLRSIGTPTVVTTSSVDGTVAFSGIQALSLSELCEIEAFKIAPALKLAGVLHAGSFASPMVTDEILRFMGNDGTPIAVTMARIANPTFSQEFIEASYSVKQRSHVGIVC